MFHRTLMILALSIAMTSVAGCAHREYAVIDEPISSGGHALTIEQVQQGIVKACLNRNWTATVKGPGLINASYAKGDRGVEVEIRFTGTSFSILPAGRDGVRAKKFNQWVRNLEHELRLQLGMLSLGEVPR